MIQDESWRWEDDGLSSGEEGGEGEASGEESGEECPICFEAMTADTITITACNHSFHTACIDDWKTKADTCPMCRAAI